MTRVPDYDVVIIGAGLVGSALACALGDSALRVALVEAGELSPEWPDSQAAIDGFDARVSALTVASRHWLQALGAWPGDQQQRVSPYEYMHVWDAEGTGSIRFSAAEVNQPVLGHIVENRLVAAGLLRRLKDGRNIEILAPVKLESLQAIDEGYRFTLDNGNTLTTSLLVAADGANSRIRQLTDIPVREWDYGHHAIVATVACAKPHQRTAWQRFLPEGPLAFLPLSTGVGDEQFCSIVWSAIPGYAQNLMALDDGEFRQQLGQAFEWRLGEISDCSRRFSFPLRQRHATDYVRPGLALVGDAAHTIHPLAGQGVNLGLMDARVLAEEILKAWQRQLNPGSEAVLKRYQRRRKTDNLAMMASMEGFKRLFEQNHLTLRWLRNTGMRWLDNATPLKRQVMRQAMGL